MSPDDFYGISAAAERFSHRSSITGAVRDYNKTLMREMSESESQWLVVDGRVETYGLYKIVYADGSCEYMSAKIADWSAAVDEILTRKGIPHEVQLIGTEYPGGLYRRSLSRMAEFLKERYGDRIVLVEAEGSEAYLDEQCQIQDFKKPESIWRNELLRAFEDDFVRATGCRRLRQPRFIVSDFYHKWGGPSVVHYVEEYYWYAFRAFSLYVDGDPRADEKAEALFEECSDLMLAFRDGSVPSASNILGSCRRMVKTRRFDEAYARLKPMADSGDPRAMAMLGEMKVRGQGIRYDVRGGERLLEAAYNAGYGPAANQLFDLVVETGPYDVAFRLVRRSALSGRRSSMVRLAMAFLQGKGTERNVGKAAHWFDKAVEGDSPADRYAAFDTVWRMGGEECNRRLASIIAPLFPAEREAVLRMGMAYEFGRGVEQDVPKAMDLYEKAASLGMPSGAARLFDVVWRTRPAGMFGRAVEALRRFADSSEPRALWRLGKACHLGLGMERDDEAAIEMCRSAMRHGLSAAGSGVFDILWDMESAEEHGRMRMLVNRYVARGEGWAYRRQGLMHLHGRGARRSLDKALACMRVSAEDGTALAYEGLLDVLWEIHTDRSSKEIRSVVLSNVGKGEDWAYRRLGMMHLCGRGAKRDPAKAMECFRKAAEMGDIPANECIFDMLWGSEDAKDVEEMRRIAEEFSSRGERWALVLQGRLLWRGVGVEKDLRKALECVRAAMEERTHKSSRCLYDILYEIGTAEAVREMTALALKYADLGETWAMNRLGNALIKGKGVKKDVPAGVELLRKAAGYGDSESVCDLYDYSRSVEDDALLADATRMLVMHADWGDPGCMMRLGKAYSAGDGMPYDMDAGREWTAEAGL